jgi:hypothetical protein
MHEVRIKKFETHYRLPQSVWRERRKLEEVRAAVLEEALQLALERAGVLDDGELCIRQIYAPIRLRVTNSEAEMAMQWSLALAAEIERAIRDGRAMNVVVYCSRRQALLELAINVARGDFSRAWAWRQLGLWQAGEQPDADEAIIAFMRTWATEGTMVMPILHALLDAGLLARVARRMKDEHWEMLARAAWAEATPLRFESSAAPSPRAVRDAMRALKSSHLLSVLTTVRAFRRESVARAIAVLVVLDEEPALLRTIHAQAVIELVANAISLNATNNDWPDAIAHKAESSRSDATLDLPASQADEAAPLDLRRHAITQQGGLLFLLGVIEELNLPDEMLAQLDARSLRWTLHQLALALVAMGANDPAALAFAGLRPDATPPNDEQGSPTESEANALQIFAARVLERLRTLLNWDASDAALLAFVCERRAEIVADSGWIEAHFSLNAVATEIRRAGLDLDPGYVSWLGVVVKFVYA